MEFNQENRSFCTPSVVLDTVAEQLADVDLTLPDYCPDIEKILKCTLTPKIQSRTLSGGQLQIDGFCTVNVMYVESINKSVRCCEQSVNFSQSFSVKDAPDNPVIITKTKSEYINCRALSPRRLVMHGAFSLYAKVFSKTQTSIFTSPDNIEILKKTVSSADLKSFCQEQFSVCEEISVGEKPRIESVLHSDISVGVTDAKAVTGKLMLNGELNLKLLYLTNVESGETGKLDYLLPFNKIIDCDGIDENTINCVSCDVMSYDIRLKNDMLSEKPSVILDVKLCVTEEGYITREEEVVCDAYSTDFSSLPEFEQLKITGEVIPLNEAHMEKLSVKVDDGKISKILDIFTDQITAEASHDDRGTVVKGKINICILALNEEDTPVFIERSADYEHIIPNNECNCAKISGARAASISYRLAEDDVIEIRCELKICGAAISENRINVVKNVNVFEDKPIPPENFALTLYFANKGEKLWDIAKSHNTRLGLLLSENPEENQVLEAPKMLLIPRI